MTSLENSIVKTISYSDYFDFPLTLPELHSRLIKFKISKKTLQASLANLVSTNKLQYSKPYYYLIGRDKLPSLRTTKFEYSQLALPRVNHLVRYLSRFPGVLAIYLTGSLAVANAQASDDIDLMIIAKPDRLWTTRFFLTIYLTIINKRRTPTSTNNSGKLCLNLYLDPHAYALPSVRRTLYTAYELIQAIPLYDPKNTQHNLLAVNSWVSDFLPNFPLPHSSFAPLTHNSSPIIRLFESFFYRLQRFYMHKRITREHITPHSAFFHPHDSGKLVLDKLNSTGRV